MAAIQISGFAGANLAIHPKSLSNSVGVASKNQKPGRTDLRPWKTPLTVAAVPAGRKTIYRMGRDVQSDSVYWLSWTTRVHAVRGFNSEDTSEQTYYTGSGTPKFTNNVIATAAAPYPTADRSLGIPVPTSAPLVSVNSGTFTGANEDVYYVYTFVNDLGWESAPSPASTVVTKKSDATTTISGIQNAPSGSYFINKVRVYRTQRGSSGKAGFFFLREFAIGPASTTDDGRALNEVLPTYDTNTSGSAWIPPPDDLSRLTALWNGMLAGISGNSVRFCEPYVPYAWPIIYEVIPPDSKPIALGTFGQTLLVLTSSRPLVVAGSSPESMDQMPLEMYQGCIAADSVVSMGYGVVWASSDGLCWYGAGGPKLVTAGIVLREDWQKLKPETIIGQMYEGLYLGSYDDGTGRKGFLIDPMNPTGIYFLSVGYEAMHFDELQDQLYVLDGIKVGRWDADATVMTANFRSKVFGLPKQFNFTCAQVVADAFPFTVYIDALNLDPLEVSQAVANHAALTSPTATSLRYTKIVENPDPFRLPSGFSAKDWQLEIQSEKPVQLFTVATSMDELAST